jgi:hypothetical protein
MPRPTRSGLKVLAVGLLGLALLLGLYVASFGPCRAMARRGQIELDTYFNAYRPLMLLCDQCESFDELMAAYSDWWLRQWPPKRRATSLAPLPNP